MGSASNRITSAHFDIDDIRRFIIPDLGCAKIQFIGKNLTLIALVRILNVIIISWNMGGINFYEQPIDINLYLLVFGLV